MKFGILDDEGQVVRWVWDKPGLGYQFITVKVPKHKRAAIDLAAFPEALL